VQPLPHLSTTRWTPTVAITANLACIRDVERRRAESPGRSASVAEWRFYSRRVRRELDKRPGSGVPGTAAERFAWCNVRPTKAVTCCCVAALLALRKLLL